MTDSYLKRLTSAFEENSEKVAMRIVGDDSQVLTFGESLERIRSLSFRMEREGIASGDRIIVMGENHPSWALAYLAALYRGAVCVPLDPQGEIETISNFFENSEAKLAFIDSGQAERFHRVEERLGRKVPAVMWQASGTDAVSSNGFRSFDEWSVTDFPDEYAKRVPASSCDDVALLIYTSGTTGTPKGVTLTHGNILAELDGIDLILSFSKEERILSLLPLFHAYLQIVNLWVATTFACEVGYLKELSPAELGNAMKEFKPTILTTVPRLWYLFHKKIFDAVEAKPAVVKVLFKAMLATNRFSRNVLGMNLGGKLFGTVHESFGGKLRLAVSAGSRFDEDVAVDFHNLGFTILQGYGLSETSGAATGTHEDDNRVGSVGKPLKGAEVKIADPNAEGVGEVLIRGGMVFKGYYQNPEATADVFTADGWFRSGDLGKFDSDGHLYIVGRAKDVIVLPSGKNVHPEDLEVHYLKTPFVEEMAIIGVNDPSQSRAGAEKLIAVVVPDFEYLKQANIANSRETIRYTLDDLGRELPEYQRVREFVVRSEPLPRTATRKIKRFELKKQFESGELNSGFDEKKTWEFTGDDNVFLETPVTKAVIRAIRNNARDVGEIHPDMNLEIDLGLDSLTRAETFAALEHAFSASFTAEKMANALTVRAVAELVSEQATAANADAATEFSWADIVNNANGDVPEVRAILKRTALFGVFAFSVFCCFYLFCRVFMRLEVEGREHLDKLADESRERNLGFLICPNHQSYIDAFVVASTYPYRVFRDIFFVGTSGIFRGRFMEFIGRLLYVVPVDPDTQLMRAMKAGAIGLKAGKILNIYPEGERSYDGTLHDFKKGAAILSTELGLPILPVALDGAYKVWPRGSWRIRPAKVKIRFGEPLPSKTEPETGRIDQIISREAQYTELTDTLKDSIRKMIAEMRKTS